MNRHVPPEVTVEALARAFAETAERHDRDASFPFENFDRLSEAGLLALVAPRRFGGGGAGLGAAMRVVGRVAEGEPSTALVLAMQYLQHARTERWPAAVVELLSREAAAGVSLVNALRVEPDLGSPARGGLPATTARKVAGGWRLDGHKIYATGAPILSWLAVFAKTNEASPRVGVFLVPARAAGVRIVQTWDAIGMRATGSHDVVFKDVALDEDAAVDLRAPHEWTPDGTMLAWNGGLLGALYDGVARAARGWLVRFLNERTPSNLGAPLASLPRFQDLVGEIERLLFSNARLLRSLAADVDAGRTPSTVESALLKTTVTENAIAVVQKAVEASGNPGLSRKNSLERHLRDVLASRVHTPQADSARLAAGRVALEHA